MYDWLDLPRPGQSTRLTEDQWTELTATLAASPSEAGYDEPAWTPALVRDYIAETFNIEYSLAHMYRVMKRAGLSYQTARPRHYKADPAEQAGVVSSKKWPPLKSAGYRIVVNDQNTQVIKTKQKRGSFPVNSRPRLPVSGARTSINLLGAIIDDGDRFISFVEGSFTEKVAAHFLRALQEEFGKELVIVLDNAPYFIAKHLEKQAAKAGLLLELPSYAPEMNPLERAGDK